MTIEDLAEMIERNVVANMATKEQIGTVRTELEAFRTEVNARLDKLEFKINQQHLNRIEKLEDDVRVLKTKAGIR